MTAAGSIFAEAFEQGRTPTIAELGGENVLVSDHALTTSNVFGDVASVLLNEWSTLHLQPEAAKFIAAGLRSNKDRSALNRAIDELTRALPSEARPFVVALESRVRDESDHDILRVSAAAGLLRLAILDHRWKHSAVAALGAIENTDDIFAAPMLCRLAAVAFEQFHDVEALNVLDRQCARDDHSGQAHLERGIIQISIALEQGSLPAIAGGLEMAEATLRLAVEADEERRDARLYYLVVQALLPLAHQTCAPSVSLSLELRELAILRDLWDAPAPGAEWLLPSPSADLEWIPLADDLYRLANDLAQPSWFDAAQAMDGVLRAYSASRAVRPNLADLSLLVKPAIEAAFVRERGLLAHLDQWITHLGGQDVGPRDATILRANVNRLALGAPPGKSPRMAPGRKPFSGRSRPG
ncbi:MAG: hypothetical protein E5V49_16845 [Mesorhizobium sp.]|nr:MAG: hypothetical protein E5V48_16470 [Mesorhizobium sp.]TJW31359.1 MAG: hypothetical protein E5V49_16845 [Mesorhizobium sp.]